MKLDEMDNVRQHLSTNEIMLLLLLFIQTFLYEGRENSASIWAFIIGVIFIFIAGTSIIKEHPLTSGYLLLTRRIFVLFIFITIVGVINGIMHDYDSLDIIKDVMKYSNFFLFYLCAGNLHENSKSKFFNILITIIYIPIIIYVLSIFVTLPPIVFDWIHVDVAAQSIPVILICLSSVFFSTSGKKKYFLLLIIPFFSVIINSTRTYWLGLLIGVIVLIVLNLLSNRTRRLSQVLVICFLLAISTLYFVNRISHSGIASERFSRSFDSINNFDPYTEQSLIAREDETHRILESIDNFIIGEGLGKNIVIIIEPYASAQHWVFWPSTWFHNAYLFFLLKLGGIGLSIFLFLLYLLLYLGYDSWKNSHDFERMVSAVFVSYIVSMSVMAFSTGNFISPNSLLVLSVLGSISISTRLQRNRDLE